MDEQNECIIRELQHLQKAAMQKQGTFVGTLSKEWVINELIGRRIQELGGTCYQLENGVLLETVPQAPEEEIEEEE